jgi:RES domain-containing protein
VNAANATRLSRVPHAGTWYRTVAPRFASTAIVTTHSRTISSRYSPATRATPGFEVLYLAENHLVAMFEAQALFGSPLIPGGVVANPTASLVNLAIHVQLSAVVDVSNPTQAALLDTNAQELTGDWLGYQQRSPATSVPGPIGKAPTQDFGEQLFALCPDVQGLLTLSARLPYYRVLAVFPQRLNKGIDYVRYSITDPAGQLQTFAIP